MKKIIHLKDLIDKSKVGKRVLVLLINKKDCNMQDRFPLISVKCRPWQKVYFLINLMLLRIYYLCSCTINKPLFLNLYFLGLWKIKYRKPWTTCVYCLDVKF